MNKRRRGIFRTIRYFIFLLLFTFIALEIILRIYNPFPNRIKGDKLVLPANQTLHYNNNRIPSLDNEITVRYNSLGFQGPDQPPQFDSALSIVTVGGSTTACWYISTDKTWPSLLSNKLSASLSDVWLNNAGIEGQSSYGHQFMLREHLLKLRPKVIIFLTGINDVDRKDIGRHDQYSPRGFKQFLLQHSEVLNIIVAYLRSRKAIEQGLHTDHIDFNKKKNDTLLLSADTIQHALQMQQPLVRAYEKRMRALIDTCLRNNIRPVLITQPMLCGSGIDSLTGMNLATVRIVRGMNGEMWNKKLELYNETLRQLAVEYKIPCIDLAAMMPKNSLYYFDFIHYTNQGTQKVAELIAPQIIQYLRSEFPHHAR